MLETCNGTTDAGLAWLLERTGADLVLGQEVHLRGQYARRYEKWAARCGWRAFVVDAVKSEARPAVPRASKARNARTDNTGGTLVAARRHVALGPVDGRGSCELVAGRCTIAHWGAAIPGGMVVCSLYLVTGVAAGDRNLGILHKVGNELRTHGRPFIVGGDWQMTAQELIATGWCDLYGAVVVAPPESGVPSCKGFGGQQGRTIDFFVVAKAVVHLVSGCSVVEEASTGRHRPVRLELRGQQQRPWVKVLKVPKAFPKERPVGPTPKGPSWTGLSTELAVNPPRGKEDLQKVYDCWAGLAESELLGLYHVGPLEQGKYRGRGGQPRLVWKRMDKVKSSAYPRTSAEGRGWRWVADRLEDLADLQLAGTERTLETRRHLLTSLRKWRPRDWGAEGQPERVASEEEVADFRGWIRGDVYNDLQGVMEVVLWARGLAAKAHSRFRTAADRTWREWVSKACSGGAGAAHRWTKECHGTPLEVGASPQQLVEDAMSMWQDIWGPTPPMLPLPDADMGAWLPELRAEHLRSAAATFSAKTALGADAWSPRQFMMLGDEALEALACIMGHMERLGAVPVELVLLVMLGKPEGGHRLIGLLTGVVRLWGRARREVAREWERAHDRDYFWAKSGSSAPESGYVQQLRAEIARAKGLQVGSTLLDLVKCYEKVLHWVLIRGAKEYGFPLVIVRLCLAVYAGPRAISAAGCVSREASLGTTIVAGCGFATTLLKVVLIRCFDAAQQAFPEVSYFVYVDDSDLDVEGDRERIETNLPGATRFVIHYLENVLHCPVSRSKSVCLASTSGLRRSLGERLRALGIGIGARGRKLGVDFTTNRRRATAKARARWASVCRRRPAVVALRRAGSRRGAVKVFKAGLMPASLYAAETHGISDTALHRMRSMAAQVGGAGGQGRSLLLTIQGGESGHDHRRRVRVCDHPPQSGPHQML